MPRKPDPAFDPDFATTDQWAAEYRAYGLQVVPCWMPGEPKMGSWKRPYLPTWTQYQEKIVSDETFSQWYSPQTGEYRNRRNMGILTGRCSDNAYIIDLDVHKNAEAAGWWNKIMVVHNNGMDLETPRQRTGGGGLQLLFRAPPGFIVPTNRTNVGVDIRGQGGFSVVPSSLHDKGTFYEWLPGCSLRDLPILMSPDWLLQEVIRVVAEHGGGSTSGSAAKTNGGASSADYDAFGHQIEGREDKMFRMVWRVLVKLCRDKPIMPTGAEAQRIMEAEYETYERGIQVQNPLFGESKRDGLNRENRGPIAWADKWRYGMSRWDKVLAAAAEPDPHPEVALDPAGEFSQAAHTAERQATFDPAQRYPYLNVRQIKAQPEPVWLIDELISEKIVGFIFGVYGTLKTFIAMDIGLSIATKRAMWWGRKLNRHGAVIYLCVEGSNRLKHRLKAWEIHRGVNADDYPFFLVEKTINFMKGEDIGKLLATVQAIKDEAGCEIAAVFVDTVSRVLPGAKENQQEHMSLFIGACDSVRERFATTVIGIHHANKEGGMRGSTVIPGAGDFVLEMKRLPGEMTGSMVAHKIKDAEDGWEKPFTVTKVPLGEPIGMSSLVVDQNDNPEAKPGGWPDKERLRLVLAEIHKEWLAGKPWSASPNSGDRYGPRIMWVKFGITAKLGKSILETWLINEVLANEMVNSDSKMKGLKVVGGVD